MRNLYYILFVSVMMLVGCYKPTVDRTTKFSLDNQSDAIVGMVCSAYPYGEVKLKVQPQNTDSLNLTVHSSAIDMGTFELCNLTDTTRLFVSVADYTRIFYDSEILTQRDRIISDHLKPVNGVGYFWKVTDELISLMEKDLSLIERYPEFYQ